MKRLAKVLAGITAPLMVVLAVSAASASLPARTLKHVSRPVAAVAIDGSRVVYSTDDDAVRVWNIRTGASVELRRGSGHYMEHPYIPEVAIAGMRVAWITLSVSGNSEETWARLYTRSLTGATHRVASAFRRDGIYYGTDEIWEGNWLTGLVGSGNVLAVSRWTTTANAEVNGVTVSNERLSVIDPGRPVLRVVATGERAIVSASAARGRVAVLRADDSIGIYSPAGRLLRQIVPSSAKEIAYGGGRVLVLTDAKTLEVYDATTGTLLHTWSVHTKTASLEAGNLAVYGRIGLYFVDPRRAGERMHLVDLATGRELVLPTTQLVWGSQPAALGALGLVYPVNRYTFGAHPRQTGTLVFLSSAKVLSMIGRR